ncbi:MAG: hypothetical protein R3B09_19535 [Nannocystaceae bacterium]
MSAPKKPGTDLSALKAKLAKKGAEAPAAAPAPAAPAAPVAAAKPIAAKPADIPAPGERAAPPPMADIPAPGERSAPAMPDIPAPGEVRKPAPAPAPVAAAPAAAQLRQPGAAGQAFGSGGGGFDPNEGLIADVGGDLPTKSNKGIVILAAAGALVFGVVLGYMLNNITSKSKLVAQGKEKGAAMFTEASETAKMRASIALAMKDIPGKIAADPKAGAEELKKLSDTNFEKHPKVENLFGWQLAAVHPTGIKKTFELYEEANGLKTDLSYLANFVGTYADALKEGGGPRLFAVRFNKGKVTLVARGAPVCGEGPCEAGKEKEATGYMVVDTVGGEEKPAQIGTEDGNIMPVDPEGQMYGYIVGLKPENNAAAVYGALLKRVADRLEAMNTAEKRALKALSNYSDNPDVDGSGQPEPGE